jgi:hypothetical protein
MAERERGDLRLLDVLLEEELGGAQRSAAAPPLRGRLWLAAAMLFGVAVVGATWWAVRANPARDVERAAQDRGVVVVEPKTGAEFLQLLGLVTRLRVQALGQLRRGLGKERIGIAGAVAVLRDPAAVQRLCNGLQRPWSDRLIYAGGDQDSDARLCLDLSDRRRVEVGIRFRGSGFFLTESSAWELAFAGSDEVEAAATAALAALLEQANSNGRLLHARVDTLDQLAALPATQRGIDCGSFGPDEADGVQRLTRLESLSVAAIDGGAIAALGALPSLRRVSLGGDALDAAKLRALARLPGLRALELRTRSDEIELQPLPLAPAELEALRSIETLQLHWIVDAAQLRALGRLPRLQELWLAVPEASAELAAGLRSLPALRRLVLTGGGSPLAGGELVRALAATRVEQLRLSQMSVDAESLRALAALPTLREVDLGTVRLGREQCLAMESWQQVRRLDVTLCGVPKDALVHLRAALDRCHVLGEAMTAGNEYDFPPEPSWTREMEEPPQDPKPPEVVQPKDIHELRRLLGDVKKIVLVRGAAPRGVPVLTDVPVLGRLFGGSDGPDPGVAEPDAVLRMMRELCDFEVPPLVFGEPTAATPGEAGDALVIDAPERVQRWVGAFRSCDTTAGDGVAVPLAPPFVLDLRLVLADGRDLIGSYRCELKDGKCIVTLGGLLLFVTADLGQLLAEVRADAAHAARLREGIALDRDDLRALPATATAIQCSPFDAATLRAELPRFRALERLAIVPVGLCQLPTGDAVAAITAVPTLRTLVLPADALTDADVGALAALPLRELGLTGRLRGVTAAPFARLRTLEALALGVDSITVDLRALLAALPALKTFALGNADLLDAAIDALLATKVERLCLQAAKLDAPRLARLAQLPSLRELRLHAARIGPDEAAALAAMKLRRLELATVVWFRPEGREDAVDLDALRARLPGSVIEEVPVRATGAWWRAPK